MSGPLILGRFFLPFRQQEIPLASGRTYLAWSAAVVCALATPAAAQSLGNALSAATPILDSNLRYEHVAQQGFSRDADAATWRTRFGWQTGAWRHIKALLEFEAVAVLDEDYNSTLNGKSAYPTVLDPAGVEVNRAQLAWAPDAHSIVTIGRQRIILDDARFIGNAGWRQDEQTFDAVRYDGAFGKLTLTAAYLNRINRVVAQEKDWHSDSWLVNAAYTVSPALKLTAFDYDLDFSNAPTSSTTTTGIRATGTAGAGQWTLAYGAQYASQADNANNPADFRLREAMLDGSATYKAVTLRLNYETLGGNGIVGFVTPLGTSHAFDGFADAFSGTGGNKTTPNGLDDLSATVTLALPVKYRTALSLIRHDLRTDRLDQPLGTEWDAVATVTLTPNLSLLAKYADFDASGPLAPPSRRKAWLALSYKL